MKRGTRREVIVVAGTNGAGKSTVINEFLATKGIEVVNPDRVAKTEADQGVPLEEANVRAWVRNRQALERVRDEGGVFVFETTLGGNTITRLLQQIVAKGGIVRIYYIGLETVELHIKRVAERVKRGGHPIPEDRIRTRYLSSFDNLVRLLDEVESVIMFDNTDQPRKIAEVEQGRLTSCVPDAPDWAKRVLLRALD